MSRDNHQANLIEIFTSPQGEGPYVGQEMTFLRFQTCAFSCEYCDTPESFQWHPKFRFEEIPNSQKFSQWNNPIPGAQLTKLINKLNTRTISLTGGEPLHHDDFLENWLPSLQNQYRILLETSGILTKALKKVISHIDIISMDLKIPSTTKMRAFWKEHEQFLKIANEKEVYVKMVVGHETPIEEVEQGLELVRKVSSQIPFILQPITPFGKIKKTINPEQLESFNKLAQRYVTHVKVIPQMHPQWGVL